MDSRGMFGERAHLYDAIYADKDYAAETATLVELLRSEGIDAGASVIEAACGTGRYLEQLRDTYTVSGFDISPPLLDIARARLPDVDLWVEDMRTFSVAQPADALLCLFSSIGYLDAAGLEQAIGRFFEAVRPGGVIVVEPWCSPADVQRGLAIMHTIDQDALKAARSAVVQVFGRKTRLDFFWTVAVAHQGVETFVERHELYMFDQDELQRMFSSAGLKARFEAFGLTGRGVWVVRKSD
ncbi:MAG: methyltransferase domain-containing protein [Myxococcota bacterium]